MSDDGNPDSDGPYYIVKKDGCYRTRRKTKDGESPFVEKTNFTLHCEAIITDPCVPLQKLLFTVHIKNTVTTPSKV